MSVRIRTENITQEDLALEIDSSNGNLPLARAIEIDSNSDSNHSNSNAPLTTATALHDVQSASKQPYGTFSADC